MYRPHRNTTELVFLTFSLFFVALAVAGAIRAYSPVPFWDMWNGYLDFYAKASSGDFSAWWAQHNEHRLVLARLFFWIDLTIFQGTAWFLILVNFLLLSFVCWVFLITWRERSGGVIGIVGFFLIAWIFSWSQRENLTWAFQSQFILAQLLPLIAFFLLHKSCVDESNSFAYFSAATLFGFLAVGSMANGVLALPLMTLFGLLVRCGWRRCTFLAMLSIFTTWVYFHGYQGVASHGSLARAIKENPVGFVEYILAYIGGPFYYLTGKGVVGLFFAKFAGAFLIITSAVFAWQTLKNPKQSTLNLSLLFFILYIGGTAFGTAGGRLIFGVKQALSSRYMTPALMAWAALIVISAPLILRLRRRTVAFIFLALLVAMLPQQMKAVKSKKDELFERNIAALAIELGIRDQGQIGFVFPNADTALASSKYSREHNISIFGLPPIQDLRERLGQKVKLEGYSTPECLGHLDSIQSIPEDPGFIRLRGWIFDSSTPPRPELLSIIGEDGKIVGFVLSGQFRPDVGLAIGENAKNSGFKGYLLSEKQGALIFITGSKVQCRLSAPISVLSF